MSQSLATTSSPISRKIIPAHFVRINDHAKEGAVKPAPEISAPADVRPKEPKITLHRENGSVKAIEIECTCGEVIRLDCEY